MTAALFVLGRRVLVGLAVGAVAATLLSLVGTGRPWPGRFGIALVLVGCVNVLMAFSGHSPGMRLGTQDAHLASVFPVSRAGSARAIRGCMSATRRCSSLRGSC